MSWPFPPPDQQLCRKRALRGLALCGRCHHGRRLRRPVRHQGLRRELDPDPTGQSAPDPLRGRLQRGRPGSAWRCECPSRRWITPYAITDADRWCGLGNVDLALTIDPQNPNITYLGGFGGDTYNSDTGLIRVDATNLQDAQSLMGVLYDSQGNLTLKTTAWTTIDNVTGRLPS